MLRIVTNGREMRVIYYIRRWPTWWHGDGTVWWSPLFDPTKRYSHIGTFRAWLGDGR
jgi:hypothetical protein